MFSTRKAAFGLILVSFILSLGALGVHNALDLASELELVQPWYLHTLVMLSFVALGVAGWVLAQTAFKQPIDLRTGLSVLLAFVLIPAFWFSAYFGVFALLWVVLLAAISFMQGFSPLRRVAALAAVFWTLIWVVLLMRWPAFPRLLKSFESEPVDLLQWGMFVLATAVVVWLAWLSRRGEGAERVVALAFLMMLLVSVLTSLGLFPKFAGEISAQTLPSLLAALALCVLCLRGLAGLRRV